MFEDGAGGRLQQDGMWLWWVEGDERVSVPPLKDFDLAVHGGRLRMLVATNLETADGVVGVLSELVHDGEIWQNPSRVAAHDAAVDGGPTLQREDGALRAAYATVDGVDWTISWDGSAWTPPTRA